MENSKTGGDSYVRAGHGRSSDKSRMSRVSKFKAVVFMLTACICMGYFQYHFVSNSTMTVVSEEYEEVTGDRETHAEVAEALSLSADSKDIKIEITVPESCPVDYVANSPYAAVYDKTANQILYAKNETEKCYPASTAKLMTAAVTLDLAPEGYDFISGSELDMLPEGASLARINKCYCLNREQIVDGIVLKGGCDVSYTAAANVGRLLYDTDDVSASDAVRKFVEVMNQTVRNIGADRTHFSNPDGHYDDDNYTTALDMVRISVYAAEHREIAESAAKESASGKLASGQSYEWINTNKMVLSGSDEYLDYITGLKTGMTTNTGYCMCAMTKYMGHEVFCVVMGCETSSQRSEDIRNLFERSFEYIDTVIEEESDEHILV